MTWIDILLSLPLLFLGTFVGVALFGLLVGMIEFLTLLVTGKDFNGKEWD